MRAGDEILQVNDKPIHSTDEFSTVLKEAAGKPVIVQVWRAGSLLNVTMTPEKEEATGRYIGGFYAGERTHVEHLSFSQALAMSLEDNKKNSLLIVKVLKKLLSRPVNISQFSGPIGIARLSGKAARAGFLSFIGLMALISLNLGLFNLLPIPPLDGSQVVRSLVGMSFEAYYQIARYGFLLIIIAWQIQPVRSVILALRDGTFSTLARSFGMPETV